MPNAQHLYHAHPGIEFGCFHIPSLTYVLDNLGNAYAECHIETTSHENWGTVAGNGLHLYIEFTNSAGVSVCPFEFEFAIIGGEKNQPHPALSQNVRNVFNDVVAAKWSLAIGFWNRWPS